MEEGRVNIRHVDEARLRRALSDFCASVESRRTLRILTTSEPSSDWSPENLRMSSPTNGMGNVISRIVLDACGRAELEAPNTGALALETFLRLCTLLLRVPEGELQNAICDLRDGFGRFQELAMMGTKGTERGEILGAMKQFSDAESALAWAVTTHAGLDGQIVFTSFDGDDVVVEKIDGNLFEVVPQPGFVDEGCSWIREDVRCLVVDGFLESVAEIDKYLQSSTTKREPGLIFCRGISEEVLATLLTNLRRRTLDVMPIVVPYDAENVNVLKDIAVVLSCDVISSLKGEMISSLRWESLPVAKKAEIRNTSTVLHTCVPDKHLRRAADELRDRLVHLDDTDMRRGILLRRLRSLSTSPVFVRFGSRSTLRKEKVDQYLRFISAFIRTGSINVDSVITRLPPGVLRDALDEVGFVCDKEAALPAISLTAAVRYGLQATLDLLSAGGALLIDVEEASIIDSSPTRGTCSTA